MKRVYTRIPRTQHKPGTHRTRLVAAAAFGATMAANVGYAAVGWALGAPGIGVRLRLAALGARCLRRGRTIGWSLLLTPLDSVRYFELEFASLCARDVPDAAHCLDVSSPRLLPLELL